MVMGVVMGVVMGMVMGVVMSMVMGVITVWALLSYLFPSLSQVLQAGYPSLD